MSDAEDTGTFTVGTACIINAPIELVWKVLLEVQNYKEWNSFVRSQEISSKGSNDHTLSVGKRIYINANIPPTFDDAKARQLKAEGIVTVIDHEKHWAEWRSDMYPKLLMRSYRYQRLSEVEEEDGRKVTRYESREGFAGVLARLVRAIYGRGLNEGFKAMGEDLKKRSEELVQHTLTVGAPPRALEASEVH